MGSRTMLILTIVLFLIVVKFENVLGQITSEEFQKILQDFDLIASEPTPPATTSEMIREETPNLQSIPSEMTQTASSLSKPLVTVTPTRVGTTRLFHMSSTSTPLNSELERRTGEASNATLGEAGSSSSPLQVSTENPIDQEAMSSETITNHHHFAVPFEDVEPNEDDNTKEDSTETQDAEDKSEEGDGNNEGIFRGNESELGNHPKYSTIGHEFVNEQELGLPINRVEEIETSTLSLEPPSYASENIEPLENQVNSFQLPAQVPVSYFNNSNVSLNVPPKLGIKNMAEDHSLTHQTETAQLPNNSSLGFHEHLPSPNALVGFKDPPTLEDAFVEALKPHESGLGQRRRRIRPEYRGKVRMKVRKVHRPNSTLDEDENEDANSAFPTTTPRIVRRYRSTTTSVPILASPGPSPPTIVPEPSNSIVLVKSVPYSNSISANETPGPQIERPLNSVTEKVNPVSSFTEKVNTFFIPSQVYTSTPIPPERQPIPSGNSNQTNGTGEWLQSSSTSDVKSVHLDDGHEHVKDRASWEKNYMNLQQNSFYRSSPETISGEETLVSLNRNKGDRTTPMAESTQPPAVFKESQNVRNREPEFLNFRGESYRQSPSQDKATTQSNVNFNVIDITTPRPLPTSAELKSVIQYSTDGNAGGIDAEEQTDESGEIEVVPVVEVDENDFYGHTQIPADLENVQTHFQTQPPTGQHSAERLYEQPIGPIRDIRLNRHQPIVSSPAVDLSKGQSTLAQIIDTQNLPNQRRHPLQSPKFLGFGIENHLNPETVYKGLLPDSELYRKRSSTSPQIQNGLQNNLEDLGRSLSRIPPTDTFKNAVIQSTSPALPQSLASQSMPYQSRTGDPERPPSITFLGGPEPTHSEPPTPSDPNFFPYGHPNDPLQFQLPHSSSPPQFQTGSAPPDLKNHPNDIEFQKHFTNPTPFHYTQPSPAQFPTNLQIPPFQNQNNPLNSNQFQSNYQGSPPFPPYHLNPANFHNNQPHSIHAQSYQDLEKAFHHNLIQSTNEPKLPPHHHTNSIPNVPPTFLSPQHTPPYYGSAPTYGNLLHHGDSSKHTKIPEGTSPVITLPMPGLVSIPTPPPESHALNQVYSNRHYPPHSHSISINPDYEPANPPLHKGHPLQYHFDPFVQNAGDFPETGDKTHSPPQFNPQENTNHVNDEPTKESFIAHQPPKSQHHNSDESPTDSDFIPPKPKKPRRSRNQKRYRKQPSQSQNMPPKNRPNFRKPNRGPQAKFDSRRLRNRDFPHRHRNFRHEESREAKSRHESFKSPTVTAQSKESKGSEPIFSENAYVLMFPNMLPPSAFTPAKPYINGKEIPVLSASDPALFEKAVGKGPASPGYHAAKVHPREQMLQVLASNHYDLEMEKYIEKKRQPPVPIHTPYGLLVPMGLPNTATTAPSASFTPSTEQHSDLDSEGTSSKSKTSLERFRVPLEKDEAKLFHSPETMEEIAESMATQYFKESSAGIEDDEIEIDVYSDPSGEFFIPLPPRHKLQHHQQDTSYSEQRPVQTSPRGKSMSSEEENSGSSRSRANGDLKKLVKSLLKERLEEMLADVVKEEAKSKEVKSKQVEIIHRTGRLNTSGMQMSSPVTLHNFLPPPPPLNQILQRQRQQFQPRTGSPLIHAPPSTPEEPSGFFQSIRKFFTFGRRNEPPKIPHHHHHVPNGNLTWRSGSPRPLPPPTPTENSLTKSNGVLKKTISMEPEYKRPFTFKSSPSSTSKNPKRGHDREDYSNSKKPSPIQRQPLKKMLKVLLQKSENNQKNELDDSNEPAGRTLSETKIPKHLNTNTSSLSHRPFIPSRSIEDADWTPIPFSPMKTSRTNERASHEVDYDQIQAESKRAGLAANMFPAALYSRAANDLSRNSILDFDAYKELMTKSKSKFTRKSRGNHLDRGKRFHEENHNSTVHV